MNKILAFCFLFGVVSAQLPSASINIQIEIDTTFEKYYQFALNFVDKIGDELDNRVETYVSAHQRLADQFRSVRNITNVKLNAASEKIINDVETLVDGLIAGYKEILDRKIFVNTLDQYMNSMRTQYEGKVQRVVSEFMKWIEQTPALVQCWNESRADIETAIQNGFLSTRSAAILALQNANATLNLNELLVSSAINSNNLYIVSCEGNSIPFLLNSCISNFLNVASASVQANVNYWASTTETAVKSNLALAETLYTSSVTTAYNNILPIAGRIEACVRSTLG